MCFGEDCRGWMVDKDVGLLGRFGCLIGGPLLVLRVGVSL